MNKTIRNNIIWIVLLVVGTVWVLSKNQKSLEYHKIQGTIFGTIYAITYQSELNIQEDVDKELKRFDYSLSPFKEQSIISKVNRNEEVELDSLFINVLKRSLEVSESTKGAFDVTISPLINAWGFGFKKGEFPDSTQVETLLAQTGYQNIKIVDGTIVKEIPELTINCSAIAKGYAVDIIGDLLESKGITNYMIDIGGEILAKGENSKGEPWRIGVNKPIDDELSQNQELQLIINLTNKALATSGNYRNFYIKDGKKYAHTINPKTGYPVQHNILSATVIADDCMTADAYATAFMVMGLEDSLQLIETLPNIAACFIYEDEKGELQTHLTPGIEDLID